MTDVTPAPAPRPPLPDSLPLSDLRPTLVCFDLDGTLVDSDAAICTSLNLALAANGVPQLPVAELRPRIGPPLQTMVADILDELLQDPALVEPIVAAYRASYARTSLEDTIPFERIVHIASRIPPPHVVGVVTTKPVQFAVPIIDRLGLRRTFAFVIGTDRGVVEPEPKTLTLERAIELHAVGDHVIMIGDRSFDIEAGRAHGATTIGVLWGNGDRQELEDAGADVICEDPFDLAEALITGRFLPGGDVDADLQALLDAADEGDDGDDGDDGDGGAAVAD